MTDPVPNSRRSPMEHEHSLPDARAGIVKPLVWECLQEGRSHRAPAPLFGSIRVERYSDDGRWSVNWSVPGYSNTLVEGDWPDADAAKAAAQTHVSAALARALTDPPASDTPS